MRIELTNLYGYEWSITSRNLNTIAAWLGEQVPKFATMNASMPEGRIRVWAEDQDEVAAMGKQVVESTMKGTGLLMSILESDMESSRFFKERLKIVSNALWCDIGKHAFPDSDPLKFEFGVRGSVGNQWGGRQPSEVIKTACGACAKDSGMKQLGEMELSDEEALNDAYAIRDRHSQPPKHIPGLPNGNGAEAIKADQELYTQFLEWKNGLRDEPGTSTATEVG